jgi:MerR family transcriptional regulator, thiopeptide resistance regulator
VAEAHRRHIGLRFYDCPPMMHAGLADMYEADARFGAFFEKYAAGLTGFVAAAIRANARRG